MDIDINVCIYTCIPQLCLMRGPRSNDTFVATISPSAQILFYKYNFPKNRKKPKLLREMADSRAGTGREQEESEHFAMPNDQKMLGACWKNIGTYMKGVQIAKFGTI